MMMMMMMMMMVVVMMMMMIMIMIMIMMMIIIMTIVSVEQHPGWGEHVSVACFLPSSDAFLNLTLPSRSTNIAAVITITLW